jgi:hypothetical protein
MSYLLPRLKEASSWGGLAGALGSLVTLLPPPWGMVAAGLGSLAGAVAFHLRDKQG